MQVNTFPKLTLLSVKQFIVLNILFFKLFTQLHQLMICALPIQ